MYPETLAGRDQTFTAISVDIHHHSGLSRNEQVRGDHRSWTAQQQLIELSDNQLKTGKHFFANVSIKGIKKGMFVLSLKVFTDFMRNPKMSAGTLDVQTS